MDLVYIVRPGEENEDLRYSLRSIAKFAPKFDKIWIIGYKPSWVSDDVLYIQTDQPISKTAWRNSRANFIEACKNLSISDDFILMNDDFIATKPIENWENLILKVKNTIPEQIELYRKQGKKDGYADAFKKFLDIMRTEFCIYNPLNYELHIPMIINKDLFLSAMNSTPQIYSYITDNYIALYRSLYGNYCSIQYHEIIDDVKLYNGDPQEITTDWISVFDDCVGNNIDYPNLNKFLQDNFPEKCIYERS